jgi:hypothetical protein
LFIVFDAISFVQCRTVRKSRDSATNRVWSLWVFAMLGVQAEPIQLPIGVIWNSRAAEHIIVKSQLYQISCGGLSRETRNAGDYLKGVPIQQE